MVYLIGKNNNSLDFANLFSTERKKGDVTIYDYEIVSAIVIKQRNAKELWNILELVKRNINI